MDTGKYIPMMPVHNAERVLFVLCPGIVYLFGAGVCSIMLLQTLSCGRFPHSSGAHEEDAVNPPASTRKTAG